MEKKLTYQEVAETMSGLFKDLNVIADKVSDVLGRVNDLPEPRNVKEQAVFEVMMGTTDIVAGSLENILRICVMYEKCKHVVGKR